MVVPLLAYVHLPEHEHDSYACTNYMYKPLENTSKESDMSVLPDFLINVLQTVAVTVCGTIFPSLHEICMRDIFSKKPNGMEQGLTSRNAFLIEININVY